MDNTSGFYPVNMGSIPVRQTTKDTMLVDDLKILLASSFSLYLKGANFHWNVEGPDFPQYHEFFGDFYSEVYGSLDRTAEYIRAMDNYTPASFARFKELTIIEDQVGGINTYMMFEELLADCEEMIAFLNDAFDKATQERQQGIANFLAERMDAFQKHAWMIRSTMKTIRS